MKNIKMSIKSKFLHGKKNPQVCVNVIDWVLLSNNTSNYFYQQINTYMDSWWEEQFS